MGRQTAPACVRARPAWRALGTVHAIEPGHARWQAREAREEDAALKAKNDNMEKPSLSLPGGIKIGF